MSSKNIEESQQQQEGKAIGSAGRDMKVPEGLGGNHEPKKHSVDLHIPNQRASSATNQRKAGESGERE